MKTKVIFRKDINTPSHEVFAVFPAMAGDNNPYRTCAIYAHVGQHSGMVIEYYTKYTYPATPEEFASLKAELESIGYDDLQVAKRFSRKDLQARINQVNHA